MLVTTCLWQVSGCWWLGGCRWRKSHMFVKFSTLKNILWACQSYRYQLYKSKTKKLTVSVICVPNVKAKNIILGRLRMRCFSTATFFSTATLKFYCRFYCHFYSHFLVAVEPKNLSTASGSRDQKTVLQPLAVELKNSSTASGSRIQKSFYCHW